MTMGLASPQRWTDQVSATSNTANRTGAQGTTLALASMHRYWCPAAAISGAARNVTCPQCAGAGFEPALRLELRYERPPGRIQSGLLTPDGDVRDITRETW
jgi:hypothetical protein